MLPSGLAGWRFLFGNLGPSLRRHAEGVMCAPDMGVRFSLQIPEVSGLKARYSVSLGYPRPSPQIKYGRCILYKLLTGDYRPGGVACT